MYSFEEIKSTFSLLDTWEDKYGYIIELGNSLKPFHESEMVAKNKVEGCVSQVWVVSRFRLVDNNTTVVELWGTSDAMIVRGLMAILFSLIDGLDVNKLLKYNFDDKFSELDLYEHISRQRLSGLNSLIASVKANVQQHISNLKD